MNIYIYTMLFNFFFRLIIFQVLLRQIFSKVEISLKPNLSLSSFFKNFSGDIKFPVDASIIEKKKLNQTYYDFRTNISYNISLPMFIEAYTEILGYEFNDVMINNSKLERGKDYYLKINYPKDLVTNYPKQIIYDSMNKSKNSYLAGIEYFPPGLTYDYQSFNSVKLIKGVTFNNIIIGLNNENHIMCYIMENENELKLVKFESLINGTNSLNSKDKVFENLIIFENQSKNTKFLLLRSNFTVYIYSFFQYFDEVKLIEEGYFINEKLRYIDISHAISKGDHIILGEKLGGLYLFTKRGDLLKEIKYFYSKEDKDTHKLLLTDMVHVKNAVYLTSKDYGIKILNITEFANAIITDFDFYHPYIVKLDTHHNPYKDYNFIGVLISDRYFNDGNEFFFELRMTDDEFSPYMFRYYLESDYLDINYFISDEKYSYLYEHNSNSILVLIRSNTVDEYNSVYKFQIPILHNVKVRQNIFFLRDTTKMINYLGILSDDTIVFIKNLRFDSARYNVEFNRKGNYSIDISTLTDYCDLKDNKTLNFDTIFLCQVHFTNYYFVFDQQFLEIFTVIFSQIFNYLFVFGIIIIILATVIYIFHSIVIPFVKDYYRRLHYSRDLKAVISEEDDINSSKKNIYKSDIQLSTLQ